MDQKPNPDRKYSDAFQAARVLREHKEEILVRWEQLIRREIKDARREDRSTLRDSIPKFLDDMSLALETLGADREVKDNLGQIAEKHAVERVKLTDYSLEEVIREYDFLRKIIFDILERHTLLNHFEREVILDSIATGMAHAGAEYVAGSEQALKVSQERFDLALRAGHIGVWDLDLIDKKVTWSDKQYEIFGISSQVEEMTYDLFFARIYPEDQEKVTQEFQNSIHDNRDFSLEYRVLGVTNEIRWVEGTGRCFNFINGRPTKMMGTNVDITEKKQAEERLKMNLAELENEKLLREQFVNALSHDLRTPLTAIKMAGQLALRKSKNDDIELLLRRVLDNVDRSDKMIQDLLDANSIRAGQGLKFKIHLVDLKKLASETVENLTSIYGNRFQLLADGDFAGYWCGEHLRRTLENLCNNAVKYSWSNTNIEIQLSDLGDEVRLSVHNSGPEIEADEVSRLFEPFQRSRSIDQRSKPGWGIGLTIVKGVTQALGGELSVTSSSIRGTTFVVRLPRDSRPFQVQDATPQPSVQA